ncbi:MAG: hypothetical protein RL033_2062 [Pseudomonadota bacterium]
MAAGVYESAPQTAQPAIVGGSPLGKPTLLLQTTYFAEEDREGAETLGLALYELLTRSRADRLAFGPGIPVRIAVHPEELALDAAQHVIVIPVLGQRALQSSEKRNSYLEKLRDWSAALTSRGALVPVLMVEGWWRDFQAKLPGLLVPQYRYDAERAGFSHTSLDIVLETCRLLHESKEDLRIFISYSTSDPASTEGPARELCKFVKAKGLEAVPHDTTARESGADRQGKLKAAAEHGVFIAVRSDGYSARHLCQRELLWAKQAPLPTLTVEVLRHGEPRSHPYGGNGPTVVWSERTKEAPDAGEAHANALRVTLVAAIEWLRARHFQSEGPRLTAGVPEPVILTRPPELLDLAQGPLLASRSLVVLHPDPELCFAEREVLRLARPRMQLVTPTTLYRAIDVSRTDGPPRPRGLQGLRVALSVSDVIDNGQVRRGIREEHAQDALVHITRAMVSAGAAIGYGGDLRVGGYDELFLDLIRSYNESGVRESELLHSYLPATFDLSKLPGHSFNVEAVEEWDHRLLPPPGPQPSRARSALYLSEMRRKMSQDCQARVLLAGQALPKMNGCKVGYSGAFPGIVEEAWHTLHPIDREPRPLYVVGGFGGAAGLVAALGTDDRALPLLQSSNFPADTYSEYRSVAAEFDKDPDRPKVGVPGTPEALACDIRKKLQTLLLSDASSLAWNGLTRAENLELFWSQDILRATALILEGLFKVKARQRGKRLEIELVSGDIVRAERANAIVLPVFQDVAIGGAGLALDNATGGAASAAHQQKLPMVALTSPQVDANWLVFANLGPFRDKEGLPAIIQEQADRISQLAWRNDFGRIALVTFAATVLDNVEGIAERMLAGFASLPDQTQLQWFEANSDRFARLQKYLGERKDVVALSHKELPELDTERAQPQNEDLFAIVRRTGAQLSCTLMLPTGPALSYEHHSSITDEALADLNRASQNTPPLADIEAMGRAIARLLFNDASLRQIEQQAPDRRLIIQHDLQSSAIPFETLHAGASVPGRGKGLVRRLSLPGTPPFTSSQRPSTRGRLRLQLIVNPTCDLEYTYREAEEVERALADEDRVEVLPSLKGRVATRENVLKALRDDSVDVLHYCGHAAFEKLGGDGSGLVCADGALLVQDLGQEPIRPRIVFFNACQSARVRNKEVTTQEVASAFAEAVLRAGVDAYLGTFWPVADSAAALFASTVYRRLARGDELHQAVTAARNELFNAGKQDWANYLLFGTGAFKLKTG